MSEEGRLSSPLFHEKHEEFPKEYLLEQYKLYVEMADRISHRRQTANSFFLSINTAVIALVGYLNTAIETKSMAGFVWPVALAGIVICYLWYRLIRSYRDLNTGKFKVIHMIEEKLPIKPYDAEWEVLGRGERKDLYLPFTHIEIAVPWVFIALHAFILLCYIPWLPIYECLARG